MVLYLIITTMINLYYLPYCTFYIITYYIVLQFIIRYLLHNYYIISKQKNIPRETGTGRKINCKTF